MRFELPPAVVRALFVLGVIAAGGAVYEFVQGARPIALGLAVAAAVALGVSSRFKQHL